MAHSASGGIYKVSQRPQDNEEYPSVLHTVPIQTPLHKLVVQAVRVQGNSVMLRIMESGISPRNGCEMEPLQLGECTQRVALDTLAGIFYRTLSAGRGCICNAAEICFNLAVGIYRVWGCHYVGLDCFPAVTVAQVVQWGRNIHCRLRWLPLIWSWVRSQVTSFSRV